MQSLIQFVKKPNFSFKNLTRATFNNFDKKFECVMVDRRISQILWR